MARICVVDTETTGLPRWDGGTARVVEVGAVILEADGSEVAAFESVVNPGEYALKVADREALRLNRLNAEHLLKAPAVVSVSMQLSAWLAAHETRVMTSFNRGFDFNPLLLGAPEWLGSDPDIRLAPCLQLSVEKIFIGAASRSTFSDYDFGAQKHWLTLRDAVGRIAALKQPTYNMLTRPTGDPPSLIGLHTALADARAAAYVARFLMPWLQDPQSWKPLVKSSVRTTLTPMTRAQLAELAKLG